MSRERCYEKGGVEYDMRLVSNTVPLFAVDIA